jgi:hypothetical protein
VSGYASGHRFGGHLETVFLGDDHLQQLAPPEEYGLQGAGFFVREDARAGADRPGEAGEDLRVDLVDLVGFGETPGGLGEVAGCLGLTTATAIPAAAATAAAAGRSYLPVASRTTSSGRTPSRRRARSSSMPVRSLATEKTSPSGSEQTSRRSLETSMPT